MYRGYLVGATPSKVFCRFFRNFTGVLVMVGRYVCGLDIILRLKKILCKLNLVIFQALYITKWTDRGYLVGATPPTVLYRFFRNFAGVLAMVWRYACGLYIILRLFLLYITSTWGLSLFQHFSPSVLPISYQCLNICSTFECKCSYMFIQFFMKHVCVCVCVCVCLCHALRYGYVFFLLQFYTNYFETSLVFWPWS